MSLLTPIEQPAFTKAPPEPEWFFRRLRELGGISPTGVPRLRVVWTGQCLKVVQGKMALAYSDTRQKKLIGVMGKSGSKETFYPADSDTQPTELIVLPVYDFVETVEHPHWVVEGWTPPEELGGWNPETQGTVPVKGCYQALLHVQNGGQYAPLNEATWLQVEAHWKRAASSKTANPYLPDTPEIQRLRREELETSLREEQARTDKAHEEELVHAAIEDRHRLHDAFRAALG